MNESKNSWSIEDLVTQMEKMQEENDDLTLLLSQKEEQIQKLSSEKSDLQSVLLALKNQLQTQSDQIVKLKGADLILKENIMLKEQDSRRLKEISETKREATTTVRACKQECESDKRRTEQRYKYYYDDLKRKYDAETSTLSTRLIISIVITCIVIMLSAVRSAVFLDDMINFITDMGNGILKFFSLTMEAGMSAAKISTGIDNPLVRDILYQVITILVAVLITATTAITGFFLIIKLIGWYKKEICDSKTILVTLAILISTIFLADEIKSIIPTNLITINLIIHMVYLGIRVYLGTSK